MRAGDVACDREPQARAGLGAGRVVPVAFLALMVCGDPPTLSALVTDIGPEAPVVQS